jgi:acetyl esterase/lipase
MRRDLIATGMMAPAMFALTSARPGWTDTGRGAPQPTASRQLLDVEGVAVEKRTLAYKQAGECAILADVYTLPKVKRAPTLLWLHGGALIWGSRTSLPAWQLALYLRAGFQVVAIDYRLAPETPLDQIVGDVEDAFRWLRGDGPALGLDPDRVGVVGYSAGGYLALLTGHRVRPRPRALVSMYGYGDILGDWIAKSDAHYSLEPPVSPEAARSSVRQAGTITEAKRADRWSFYLFCRQRGLWPKEVSGHDPALERAWFEPYCPALQVDRQYPPTFLLHGDEDTDVAFAQSVLMEDRMRQQQVPQTLLRMSGYDHAFDLMGKGLADPKIKHAYDEVLDFLRDHVR